MDVPFSLVTALADQGAKFHVGILWAPYSLVDGHLVTGQNPASALPRK